jgi:isohexenylglutaconyl-CoA hydratase
MTLPETQLLNLRREGIALTARIDDPKTRNAMSETLMAEFEAVLAAIQGDRSVRAFIVRGTDGAFCAGADLKQTREALASPPMPGIRDPLIDLNERAGRLFAQLNACPALCIAVVDGPAMGGGFGLACCMDVTLATPRARFALSETTLGVPPAQIAPYVVARIGRAAARRLALTGQRLDGVQANTIGLVDYFFESDVGVEEHLVELLTMVRRCAPNANAEAKRLILNTGGLAEKAYIAEAASSFAACLRGEEGHEGLAAFAEKRPAKWMEGDR